MGRYETQGHCLDCQRALAGVVCRSCGLPQTGPEADQLRAKLAEADAILLRIRQAARPLAPVSHFGPSAGQAPTTVQPLLPIPPALPGRRAWPALTTPVILLGLGAVCVLAAAIVFVTVSWSDLSLATKAAILLGVTAVLSFIGGWSLRARLRGTAETFAGLSVLMVGLDFLAARSGGLAGVDTLPDRIVPWAAAGLLLVTSVAWATASVRRFEALTVVQLSGAAGVAWLSGLILDEITWRPEYVALVVSLLVLAAALLLARLALWTMAVLSVGIGAVFAAVSFGVALSHVNDHHTLSGLWSTGDAFGWLMWCLLMGSAAAAGALPMRWRAVFATAAGLGLVLLALRPLEGSRPDVVIGVFASTALVISVVSALPRLADPWRPGARVAAAAPGLIAAAFLAPVVAHCLSRVADGLEEPWDAQQTSALRDHLDRVGDLPSPLIGGAVLVALVLATALLATRRLVPWHRMTLAVPAASALVVLRYDAELWLLVLVLVGAAIMAGAVAVLTRDQWARGIGAGLAAFAFAVSLASEVTTLETSIALTLTFSALAWRAQRDDVLNAATSAGMLAAGLGLAAAVVLADGDQSVVGCALAALGSLAVVCAQLRQTGRPIRPRVGLEIGGSAVAIAGVVVSIVDPRWALPLSLTLLGASLVGAALWRADRRVFSVVGGLLLASATWVRLLVEDVSVVEAYTLPSAVVLVAFGVWRMRVATVSSFSVLTPGLSLALFPSLLVTLPEPTSLRALLLGLAALAVVMAGAVLRWAAPMFAGGGVVVALAVVNLAPYAQALPRWVLFAAVGALLLYLGVTWERRLRNLRSITAAMEYVR